MGTVPPKSAARRLASELALPSWKGTVLVAHRLNQDILIVAAERRWLTRHSVPSQYCGYAVETDEPLDAVAQ